MEKSMDLVEVVYSITANFPKEERYGLASQMQKAAVSIPSNIAEGTARKSNKELLQFISIALGSVAELETQYLIGIRLRYITEDNAIINLITDVKKLLLGFRNFIKKA